MFKVNDYQTATLTPTKLLLNDPLTSSNWNFQQATMTEFMNDAVGAHPLDSIGFANKYSTSKTTPKLALPPSPPSPGFRSFLPGIDTTTTMQQNGKDSDQLYTQTSQESVTASSPKSSSSKASSVNSTTSPIAKQQRKRLLEKNREAAYRCRQKKKRWVNGLEEKSQIAQAKNDELQEELKQLREESIYLRNLLLTHGNCNCDVVQSYLRRTSEQLSNKVSSTSALMNGGIGGSTSHSASLAVGFGESSSVGSSENGSHLFSNSRATPPYEHHYPHDIMTQQQPY